MAFAQGTRSQLTYVVESTFGTTPGSPSMLTLPFVSHSLDLTKERLQSEEILSDRIPRIDRHGNRSAVGDIVVELHDTDYDDLIESAMFSSFDTSGVMKVGTTPKYMTIEDGALDVSEYRQFTGCAVDQMSISIAPNQMVNTTFSMIGKDMTQAATSLDASPTAAAGGQPFDSYSGSLSEGGSAANIVTALDFTVTNSLSPTFVVGSASTPQLEYGRCNIEGTVSVYYEDEVLINKFLNETASTLSVTVDDPTTGSGMTFLFPEVKYNGASVPVSNPQSRIITMPFVAIYDATEATNLKITKT